MTSVLLLVGALIVVLLLGSIYGRAQIVARNKRLMASEDSLLAQEPALQAGYDPTLVEQIRSLVADYCKIEKEHGFLATD